MIQLDLTYLNTISGGDQAFIHEMLKMFLTTTFPEMEALKQHASEGTWDLFGSTAHKMKAPIQMLGVPAVADLVFDLEHIGKSKIGVEGVSQKVQLLEEYIKELEIEINKILNA